MLGEVIIGVDLDTRPALAKQAALERSLRGMSGGSMGRGIGGTGAAALTASQRLNNLATSVGNVAKKMGTAGRMLTWRVTLPLVGIGVASVRAANTFEQSFARIGALAGKIGVPVAEAERKVKELATKYGQAPQDVADSLYFIASAGLKASDVMGVLEESTKAAAMGLSDAGTMAQLLTTLMNNYGESGMTAAKGMDVLTAAIKVGKAEPQDLAFSLSNVVAQGSQLKISFASMAGAIAQGTNAGLSAARAATGLRFILTSLQKPTTSAQKVLKDYGLTVGDLQTKFSELGATGGIQYLSKLFDTTTTKGREAFATVMGGQRGLILANTLIGENLKNAQRIDAFMVKSAGSGIADRAFAKATDTQAFKFKKAMATLKVAAIDLGNTLVPILVNDVLPVIQKIADGFKAMSPEGKRMLVWVGIFTAILGPALQLASVLGWIAKWGVAGVAGLVGTLGVGSGSSAVTRLARYGEPRAVPGLTLTTAGGAAEGTAAAIGTGIGTAFMLVVAAGLAGVLTAAVVNALQARAVRATVASYKDPSTAGSIPGLPPGFIQPGATQNFSDRTGPLPRTPRAPLAPFANPEGPQRIFLRERDRLVRTYRISNEELLRWTKQIVKGRGITDDDTRAIAQQVRILDAYGAALDATKRKQIETLLKAGDVNSALKLLRDAAQQAASGLVNSLAHISERLFGETQLGAGNVSGTGINRFTITRNRAEHGAIVGLAAGGFLVDRPTFIRRDVLTGENRKKEAVIPLEDVRGRRVLAGALSDAMGSRGASTVVVNVAGKVERPEDIRREMDWWLRSRGL